MNRKWVLILAAVLILAIGVVAWLWLSKVDSSEPNEPQSQADAIEQARNYKTPEGTACAAVMTPAVHQATGAQYTFPSSCLAPGWEDER